MGYVTCGKTKKVKRLKLRKGDRVCALLVCNKWGVELTCFVGELLKVEKTTYSTVVSINVDFYMDLTSKRKQPPHVFTLDAKLFKVLPWTLEMQEKIRAVRDQARLLDQATKTLRTT
jgi:hypothetical protein